VLFDSQVTLLQNWKEHPFFKSLAKDRYDLNVTMGNKFNLNFNAPDIENIFKPAPNSEELIKRGERANIVWAPLKASNEVRWNSYEIGSSSNE